MDNENRKCGFVAIIGRPNVGKSTLLNTMLGEKIAIVSKKPQTTRTAITGILTKDNVQYVFIDTPGIHKTRTRLGDYMVKSAYSSITGADVVLFVVEADCKPNQTELSIIEKLKTLGVPIYLIINKTDIKSKEKLGQTILDYSPLMEFIDVIPISALKNDGVDIILDEVKEHFAEPRFFFPEDMITDQPERLIAAEVIREKILRLTDDEIPHGTAVTIEDFTEKKDLISIRAEIFCEKASHKGIIIGKNGETIKKIGTYAREDLEAFFGCRVYIDLWVKVKKNWRDSVSAAKNFGYFED
ncbi:MAG: GTPase Era [Clostridia bacterium]|nr:GTPase Era [Clostridia bacterium]